MGAFGLWVAGVVGGGIIGWEGLALVGWGGYRTLCLVLVYSSVGYVGSTPNLPLIKVFALSALFVRRVTQDTKPAYRYKESRLLSFIDF